MKAVLVGILVGLATASPVSLHRDPWDSTIKLPSPTQQLVWGDVNVLHTTDIHGWISGHSKDVYPEKSWSGNFGDFYSFVTHMREKAKANGQDASLLYYDMGYDLVVPGNHDLRNSAVVDFTINALKPLWGEKYLTSNVYITKVKPGEGKDHLGAKFRKWTTDNGRRMMAFGVVTNGSTHPGTPETIKIEPINKMIENEWFKTAIASAKDTDVFVLLGHVDPNPKRPTCSNNIMLIYEAIRKQHPLTPIMIFTGHSHKRWCKIIQNEYGSKRSMLLQSGHYFDTVGWMSVTLDGNTESEDLKFNHRYLDNNLATYMFHTNKTYDFFTPQGRNITCFIQKMEENKALNKVFGQLDLDYYLDCNTWVKDGVTGSKEGDTNQNKNSLFSFYLDAVETTLIKPESKHWLFFSNWGVLQGDIYRGPFTKADLYAISPDDRSPFLYATVCCTIADKIKDKVQELQITKANNDAKREKEEMEKDEREKQKKGSKKFERLYKSNTKIIGTNVDHYQSCFELPPINPNPNPKEDELTYGQKTQDECEGPGDDILHLNIPQVEFDATNMYPVYFWRKNFQDNLPKDKFVNIITTNYIGNSYVFKALEELVGEHVIKPRLAPYRDNITQDNLLEKYVSSKFPYRPAPGKPQ
ncbi:ser thr protein phosphatase, partial [Rhizoctonia solani]